MGSVSEDVAAFAESIPGYYAAKLAALRSFANRGIDEPGPRDEPRAAVRLTEVHPGTPDCYRFVIEMRFVRKTEAAALFAVEGGGEAWFPLKSIRVRSMLLKSDVGHTFKVDMSVGMFRQKKAAMERQAS